MSKRAIREKYTLIVGADSLLGSYLFHHQSALGLVCRGTTRRENSALTKFRLGEDSPSDLMLSDIYSCIICAGITKFADCENNPSRSTRINVRATFELIHTLSRKAIHTVFLSSDAVFDGLSAHPDETSPPKPTSAYGHQKFACEQLILGDPMCRAMTAIVRLTKCISRHTPIIAQALDVTATPVTAYTNRFLSPISVSFACAGIAKISQSRKSGIFHLSGSSDISYYDFLGRILDTFHAPRERITPIKEPPDRSPRHSSLGMKVTVDKLGIEPQTFEDALVSFEYIAAM
jgi:dTDP-4-dehydrorhamnose reductase